MFLRRIAQHLKNQNWFAAAIDFLIVVSSIFIGLQATNYSTELKEKALLKEKLTILLIETREVITDSKALPTTLEKLIIDSDKLLEITNSCRKNDELSNLLTSIASYNSMEDSFQLSVNDLEPYFPLLSSTFRTELRAYKRMTSALINHSISNTQFIKDLHILKSPYIGMKYSGLSLTLNQPIEEICTNPDFIKYIILPKSMAEIEIRIINAFQKRTITFEKIIKNEIKRLN